MLALFLCSALLFDLNIFVLHQWRIGLLWSNLTAADQNVPLAVQYAINRVNDVNNRDSPLFSMQGRETLVLLSTNVATDDCAATPGSCSLRFDRSISICVCRVG